MSSPAPGATQATQAKKPKGILKKPSATATPRAPRAPTTPAPELAEIPVTPFPISEHQQRTDKKPTARELAIQQALLIQAQRDREDQIQDSIIELARLPLCTSSSPSSTTTTSPSPQTPKTTYTASNPSPSDASQFLTAVRLFQPSEYEDLIIERNALNKCGYCLCPRPRTRLSGGGAYKLLNYGRPDFSIVPRAELERWCSRQCARRAMYVKVQLVETAAAERAGVESIRIELLEEEEEEEGKKEATSNSTTKAKAKPGAEEDVLKEEDGGEDPARRVAKELRDLEAKERKAARDAKELARERGDKTNLPSTGKQVTVTIREKKVIMAAQEPSLDTDGEGHLVLDGYKTKFDPKAEPDER
ncbi:uncharacterized protein F4807DRAFT_213856 [Annulohypoxylon truncatum]|uniref:uncharacterized protein n=1 Tax=Annulohypoxylon truncatum TaxID=327061 RepID=UPI00200728F0|nr:uncharacterized protein F4807DRAFT_213856 [Annulohypoxylon truncatum]KAI1207092.1 hypothetical protein F4807DRAFT_213856 [Annulohypoxylon truncatum]